MHCIFDSNELNENVKKYHTHCNSGTSRATMVSKLGRWLKRKGISNSSTTGHETEIEG